MAREGRQAQFMRQGQDEVCNFSLCGETLTLCFIEAAHRWHIRIQITPCLYAYVYLSSY